MLYIKLLISHETLVKIVYFWWSISGSLTFLFCISPYYVWVEINVGFPPKSLKVAWLRFTLLHESFPRSRPARILSAVSVEMSNLFQILRSFRTGTIQHRVFLSGGFKKVRLYLVLEKHVFLNIELINALYVRERTKNPSRDSTVSYLLC